MFCLVVKLQRERDKQKGFEIDNASKQRLTTALKAENFGKDKLGTEAIFPENY